jgi:hypothetical protein
MTGRRERLLQSTNLIILGGVFMFLFVVSGAIAYGARAGYVWINLCGEWSIWLMLNASCIVQTLAFDPRGAMSSSSSEETFSGSSPTKKSNGIISSPSDSNVSRSTKTVSGNQF